MFHQWAKFMERASFVVTSKCPEAMLIMNTKWCLGDATGSKYLYVISIASCRMVKLEVRFEECLDYVKGAFSRLFLKFIPVHPRVVCIVGWAC